MWRGRRSIKCTIYPKSHESPCFPFIRPPLYGFVVILHTDKELLTRRSQKRGLWRWRAFVVIFVALLAAGASFHRQVENLGLPHTLCCILKHVCAWELLHVSPALDVHGNNKEIKKIADRVMSLQGGPAVCLHWYQPPCGSDSSINRNLR